MIKNNFQKIETVIPSPVGFLKLSIVEEALIGIEFLPNFRKKKQTASKSSKANINESPAFLQQIIQALQTYFQNPQQSFQLPLQLKVTAFQERVLKALQKIPVGTTETYGNLAKKLKTSARAVGNACRRNPIAIVIPCHRVVGKNNPGGFCGEKDGKMLAIKQWLLEHEREK